MVKTNPTSQGAGTKNSLLPLYLTGVFLAVIAAAYLSLWLGHLLSGTSDHVPGNPFTALIETAGGDLTWPTVSTVLVVVMLVVGAGAAGVLAAALGKRSGNGIDDKARLMGSTANLTGVTGKQAAARARALRGDLDEDRQLTDADIGVLVGQTVQGRKKLFASWEDMILALAGPRMGKTAALAIDNLCTAPGPALFTSNKRDGHDATRVLRAGKGTVWRYDLQAIADGPHVTGTGSTGIRCGRWSPSSLPASSPPISLPPPAMMRHEWMPTSTAARRSCWRR